MAHRAAGAAADDELVAALRERFAALGLISNAGRETQGLGGEPVENKEVNGLVPGR